MGDDTDLVRIGYFSKTTEAWNWDIATAVRCSIRLPVSMPPMDPGELDGTSPRAENGEGRVAPGYPPRADEASKTDKENEDDDNMNDELDKDADEDKKDKENEKHNMPPEQNSGNKTPRTLRPQASAPL